MKLGDSFNLSINGVLHRKLRSWLTLFGIIIGVASVIAIVSIGEGAQQSVNQQLSGLGADIVTISPGYSRATGFAGSVRGGGNVMIMTGTTRTTDTSPDPTLTSKDTLIIRNNENVVSVMETFSGRGEGAFLAEKTNVSIEGVNPTTWPAVGSPQLAAGRLLTSSDSGVIVISDRLANSVFKTPITLGRKIVIEDKPFTVIGILESSTASAFGGGSGLAAYMTINDAWNTVEDANRNTYSSIQAKVKGPVLVEETVEQLTQSLLISRKVNERSQNFSITSAQAIKEQVNSVTETLTLFLGAIAAIALIVGAIGVANSMFTSVLEKIKQIGILKALGTTNQEILTIFVMESALFGLVGGILGAILGTLISSLLASTGIISIPGVGGSRGGFTTLVTPELVIFVVVLSTVIGIVAGIIPAQSASKLKPVDALRYE